MLSPEVSHTNIFRPEGFQLPAHSLPLEETIERLQFAGALPYPSRRGPESKLPRQYRPLLKDLEDANRQVAYVGSTMDDPKVIGPGNYLWNYIIGVRRWLQSEIRYFPALLNHPQIAADAMFYGAIPDEDTSFLHVLQPDQTHRCYTCESSSLVKFVYKKVVYRGFNLPTGQVVEAPIAWCESCEDVEPPSEAEYVTFAGPQAEGIWIS